MTATAQMTTQEFTAAIAALCGPGEAALLLITAGEGLSYCICSAEGAHETAASYSADPGQVDDDVLLGVAVVTADGTLTEYPMAS